MGLMLLSREQGLADEAAGSERWSVDHLFADRDGTPTLIEVKRSSDTRIRREVVEQLLEYAANAVEHWRADQLRARFADACAERGTDSATELRGLLGEDCDPEACWEALETNLKVGRLRLVFVSDRISRELARIVEFLNDRWARRRSSR